MKLIVRADDLGFSEAVNCGILKAIQDGVVTSVGLMSNMSSSRHGYKLIQKENVSLGLHCNISAGYPVCDLQLIPTLVKSNGEFYSSQDIHARKFDTINIKECEKEIEAQLHQFIEISGREPDYVEGHAVFSQNFFIAIENVCQKYNLFFSNPRISKQWEKENGIHGLGFVDLDENGLYDPQEYMETHLEELKENPVNVAVFHPGYLDQYILNHSSYTFIRVMECEFLCSQWLKDFIKSNQIELIDFRDCTKNRILKES